MLDFLTSESFITYFAIPALIMIARVIDVTLGTIRMVFISKGEKFLAAGLGFFEVLVWLIAITRIMENLTNVLAYVAYATGFAVGTYLGIAIEQKMLIGKVIVRVTTSKDSKELVEELRKKRYTFTCIGVDGPGGIVQSLHVIIHKKDLNKLLNYINTSDKDAFYTVEDVRIVAERNTHVPQETAIIDNKRK
jgi:uncharacterized protein YebE (UPF0316 family)